MLTWCPQCPGLAPALLGSPSYATHDEEAVQEHGRSLRAPAQALSSNTDETQGSLQACSDVALAFLKHSSAEGEAELELSMTSGAIERPLLMG